MFDHDKCHYCSSIDLEKRNIKTQSDADGEFEVEFTLYCKQCGEYVASFDSGHWEY